MQVMMEAIVYISWFTVCGIWVMTGSNDQLKEAASDSKSSMCLLGLPEIETIVPLICFLSFPSIKAVNVGIGGG